MIINNKDEDRFIHKKTNIEGYHEKSINLYLNENSNNEIYKNVSFDKLMCEINALSIFALDRDYRYLMMNKKHKDFMKKFFNIDIKIGMNMMEAIDEFCKSDCKYAFIDRMKEIYNAILQKKSLEFNEEVLILNDNIEYVKSQFIPSFDEEGNIETILVCMLNITENMSMGKALLKARMKINSFKRSNIDHVDDLKYKIESMTKIINTLYESELVVTKQEYLQDVRNSIEHIRKGIEYIIKNGSKKSDEVLNIVTIYSSEKKGENYKKPMKDLSNNITNKNYITMKKDNVVLRKYNKNLTKMDNKKVKILVAEDNSVNQMFISELIKMNGWEVAIVNNGKEVIEALQKDIYNIILMDISMPIMDGIEATKIIKNKEEYNQIPIVALTAHVINKDENKFKELGMDDYLLKPIDNKKLNYIVSKYVKINEDMDGGNIKGIDIKEYEEGFVRLEELLQGNTKLIIDLGQKIVEMFSQEELNNIIYLAEEGNILELRGVIHKLKGAILNFKLNKIQDILIRIREKAINREMDEIYDLVRDLSKNIDIFEEKLTIYKHKCKKSK